MSSSAAHPTTENTTPGSADNIADDSLQKYLQPARVQEALADLATWQAGETRISNIVDKDGHQYVDIVLEGGGTLGVALLGYLYGLEQAGIRFIGLGGNSAGGIVAVAMAAAGKPHEERATKLIPIVADADFYSFMDTKHKHFKWLLFRIKGLLGRLSKRKRERLAQRMAAMETGQPPSWVRRKMDWLKGKFKWLKPYAAPASILIGLFAVSWYLPLLLPILAVIAVAVFYRPLRDVRANRSLFHGDEFLRWARETLSKFNVSTVGQLNQQYADIDYLYLRDDHDNLSDQPINLKKDYAATQAGQPWALITSDITTETKVTFPSMGPMYFKEFEQKPLAELVRCTMSLPVIFKPVPATVQHNPVSKKGWEDTKYSLADYEKIGEVDFVDGGLLSNFPMAAFHVDGTPNCPTFGAKLGLPRTKSDTSSLLKVIIGSFNASRYYLDHSVIIENDDFRQLINWIDIRDPDTEEEVDWLNFDMSDHDKITLFANGVCAARDFLVGADPLGNRPELLGFNWKKYTEYRGAALVAKEAASDKKAKDAQLAQGDTPAQGDETGKKA